MSYTDSFPSQENQSSHHPSLAYMASGGASAAMIPPDVLAMIDEAKRNGWGTQFASWMGAHTGRLVLITVLLLGTLGIFLTVSTHPALSPTHEEGTIKRVQTDSSVSSQAEALGVWEDTSLDDSDAAISGEVITEVTGRGEGITHLARRALAARIAQRDIHLSREQLVYAEDYVQNAIGAHALGVGEKLSFTQELLDEASGAALSLSPEQIEKLSAYAQLVKWE